MLEATHLVGSTLQAIHRHFAVGFTAGCNALKDHFISYRRVLIWSCLFKLTLVIVIMHRSVNGFWTFKASIINRTIGLPLVAYILTCLVFSRYCLLVNDFPGSRITSLLDHLSLCLLRLSLPKETKCQLVEHIGDSIADRGIFALMISICGYLCLVGLFLVA